MRIEQKFWIFYKWPIFESVPFFSSNFIYRARTINPIPPRLFSNLFPLGGGRYVSLPVELDTKIAKSVPKHKRPGVKEILINHTS